MLAQVFKGQLDPELGVSGALCHAALQVGNVVCLADEVALVLGRHAHVQRRQVALGPLACGRTIFFKAFLKNENRYSKQSSQGS